MREHMLDHGQLGLATGLGESLSMSSIQEDPGKQIPSPIPEPSFTPQVPTLPADDEETDPNATDPTAEDFSIHASQLLGRRLSDAVISSASDPKPPLESKTRSYLGGNGGAVIEHSSDAPEAPIEIPTTHPVSPSDLTGHPMSSPELAVSRSPPIPVTSAQVPVSRPSLINAPILVNPKCSGYFLEPVSQTFLY